MGVSFQVLAVDVDETCEPNENAEQFVSRMAMDKALAGKKKIAQKNSIVMGADTIIHYRNQIIGKPRNREHACEILTLLSGQTHHVLTAVACCNRHQAVKINCNQVSFRPISALEIDAYWRTGEPEDKAGGYAIQGWAAIFIEQIKGSYSGIMGLPLFETAMLLKAFGVDVLLNEHS